MSDKGEANMQGRPIPRGHSWGCPSLEQPVSGTKGSDDNAKDTDQRTHRRKRDSGQVCGTTDS